MTEENNNENNNAGADTQPPAVDSDSVMGKALQAAERLEAANAKTEELIKRQEALAVQNTLGGSASTNVEPPKEESPEEYAKKAMSGDLNDEE